jgi:heme exporter protein CcmD
MRADHLDFVVAAYAAAILIVGFMVVSTLSERRRLRRALSQFKPRGDESA